MGIFVNLVGHLQCVRCGTTSEEPIATKLLRTGHDNSCHEYRIGDSEVIDGIDDFVPLLPWTGSQLVVAVGDWSCSRCGLNWQWAKAVFDIDEKAGRMIGTLRKLSTLQPGSPDSLMDVHYLEGDLAELSGLWKQPYDWRAGLTCWQELAVDVRRELVAAGYRAWAHEVAGVELPLPEKGS